MRSFALIVVLAASCTRDTGQVGEVIGVIQSKRVTSIEQIDLETRQGLAGSKEAIEAKATVTITEQARIEEFAKSLRDDLSATHHYNHPVSLGDIVLRINAGTDKYFIFIGVHKVEGTNYCVLRIGQKNDANINHMPAWQSLEMIEWLDGVKMKPR
jgi:hypothetical protein